MQGRTTQVQNFPRSDFNVLLKVMDMAFSQEVVFFFSQAKYIWQLPAMKQTDDITRLHGLRTNCQETLLRNGKLPILKITIFLIY